MRLWLRSGSYLPQAGTDVDTTKGVNHRHQRTFKAVKVLNQNCYLTHVVVFLVLINCNIETENFVFTSSLCIMRVGPEIWGLIQSETRYT